MRTNWALAIPIILVISACSSHARSAGTDAQQSPVLLAPDQEASACPSETNAHRYIQSVSANGRYFVDQAGAAILVQGDSPWSGLLDWSPQQAETYFGNREANGFNASIMALIGAIDNGGPSDDGSTYDGVTPFIDGNILNWNAPYWERVDLYLRTACAHGNTIFLYPVDGWNIKTLFASATDEEARQFGQRVANRYANFPNIVWMTGGDYFPEDPDSESGSEIDGTFAALLQGIRDAGNVRPFSIQLGYFKSLSTDDRFWSKLADWNFVYTYNPTYKAVLDAYERPYGEGDPRPALLAESTYENENNRQDPQPTTDETLRRQALWALTSGSPGEFRGSQDWNFEPGWENRLDTEAVRQGTAIRELFAARNWWTLEPDTNDALVTSGRGTKLSNDDDINMMDNDYVTAARSEDGSLAVIYVPSTRTITLDTKKLMAPYTARWIDPANAIAPGALATIDPLGRSSTPGTNYAGGTDWILLIESAANGS